MLTLKRQLIVAALLVSACKSSSSSPPPPPGLTMSLSVDSGDVPGVSNGVKADGNNTVTINVSGSTQGPIKVTTHKGTFLGGGQTATIAGTSGQVTLFTCDARTDNGCAGSTTVSATDANFAFGQTTVTFVGFETN